MLRYAFAILLGLSSLLLLADDLPPGVKDTQNPKDQPPSPEEAVRRFKVPDGFEVTLFAGEPDVRQPIAMTFDDRGRLWVAECYSYPDWKETGQDRILIFEDTDGDGRFDKGKVFLDKLANLSGILWGHGGIWACTAPNLVFIPDRNGDDKPDGPPEVVLDGWSTKSKHNIVNGLAWGPDGWLYGCHGILSESKVGRAGDPDEKRTRINCGIWRYQPPPTPPKRGGQEGPLLAGGVGGGRFEVVAHGTTNPWGLDWNEHGEAFFVNCVIGHLWHLIPGAHYKRMYGLDYNPHAYELIDATSDHLHWGGGDWTTSRGGKGVHSDAGGGHAHSGAMVYLGDNFPDEYRGRIFMANLHGNRLNVNKLERQGCGYVGKRAPDFLTSDNEWFRGVAIAYGPDGGVYVTDWCDHGECHDDDGVHRSSGRIYKVIYKPTHKRFLAFDLSKRSDQELVELLKHKNAWWGRHAQRLLAERKLSGQLASDTPKRITAAYKQENDPERELPYLWAMHATGAWSEASLLRTARLEKNEYLRAWAWRLLMDHPAPSEAVLDAVRIAPGTESCGFVKLHLAGIMQRMPMKDRLRLASGLAQDESEAKDRCLPPLIWYGIEPAVMGDVQAALTFASDSKMDQLTRYVYRRLAEGTGTNDDTLELAVGRLARGIPQERKQAAVSGLLDGLRGRKNVRMPPGWPEAEPGLRRQSGVCYLDLLFDAPGARRRVEAIARVVGGRDHERAEAVRALAAKRPDGLPGLLHDLLSDPAIRGEAIRALAAAHHDQTPKVLLKLYPSLPDAEKHDAIATLASRAKFAHALLDAIEQKQVPRGDVSAFTARQILDLGDKELSAKLTRVWGELRQTSAEKKKLIEDYKARLGEGVIAQADPANGKRVFERTCAQCHTLFHEGGKVGPDLTGSNRKDLHYVLENTLDPSAVVGRDYQLTNFLLQDGRLVAGIIVEETARAVTVQTANERLVLAKEDIDQRKTSKQSMMPEGLIEKLTAEELRDLVGYLRR